MVASEETCHKERAEDGPPLFQNGNIVFQAYHVGWIIAGFFAIVATAVSIWLVNKHLRWYTNKREQRYIVRILFMVPIYALVSFASFLFWNHSTILILVRDCYESTVLTAFFYLLLMYLSHDPEEQKAIFLRAGLSREADREARKKGEKVKKWVFPMGCVKKKPHDGLYFLQLMKWGVLQYCVIRPLTTLAAVILDYMGLYCEESWGFGWGHVYNVIIVSISVTVAMYCLIQLYVPVSKELAPHRPLLKLFAIKAVVFLTFWQATFLSVLSMFGVVNDTKYMTAADINIGIGAILETFEMTIFAFLHIRAFSYKPYRPFHAPDSMELDPEPTPRLRSLGHALDFRETLREIWVGCVYIWDKMRGREPTPDVGARRVAHYEGAFGRPRASRINAGKPKSRKSNFSTAKEDETSATLPAVEIGIEEEVNVDISGERQWLGVGDDYGYGLGYVRREKSESLGVQIELELERRGYASHIPGRGHIGHPPDIAPGKDTKRQPSWWRRIYNRFSEHGDEHGDERGTSLIVHRSKRHSRGTKDADRDLHEPDNDDPPFPSVVHHHRSRRNSWSTKDDVLAPLPIFKDPRMPRQWAPPNIEDPNSLLNIMASSDTRSVDTRAPATVVAQTESSHNDSLFGRVFPRSAESRPGFASSTSVGAPSNGSIDEEGRERLARAMRHMLGQYYEFGAPVEYVTPRTQNTYHDVPGPSKVEAIDLRHPLLSDVSTSHHRRESALHRPSVSPPHEAVPVKQGAQGRHRNPNTRVAPPRSSSGPEAIGQYPMLNTPSIPQHTCIHQITGSESIDYRSRDRMPVVGAARQRSGQANPLQNTMNIPGLPDHSRYPSTSQHPYPYIYAFPHHDLGPVVQVDTGTGESRSLHDPDDIY